MDGSACLWVDSTSGRQYSRITAVDNVAKTVTVATAYGVTEATRNWGIGGKRLTLDHADTKTLGADAQPGWIIELDAGSTQTLVTTFTFTADGDTTTGRIIIRGATGTRAIITSATNSVALFSLNAANYIDFSHLNLTHTAATRGNGITAITATSNRIWITDCIIDGCLVGINQTASAGFLTVSKCEIKNCTSHGITLVAAGPYLFANYIHDNAGSGIIINAIAAAPVIVLCVIVKNTGSGINTAGGANNFLFYVFTCTIADNTGSGIANPANAGGPGTYALANNLIYGNGAWGINSNPTQAGTDANTALDFNNAFGGNSSGPRTGITTPASDITLTANPFTDDSGANRDFSLNTTAGGGAACRAAGYPGAFAGGSFVGYPDVGAVQHADAGGATTIQISTILAQVSDRARAVAY